MGGLALGPFSYWHVLMVAIILAVLASRTRR
jgi:hypothetical protein